MSPTPPQSLALQSPTAPTFTLTQHKKVILPKLSPISPVKTANSFSSVPIPISTTPTSGEPPPRPPPRGIRHSSLSSSCDVPIGMDGNVLRKVASLTLEKNKVDNNFENKIIRPKLVPNKLDFAIFEKFEGLQQILDRLIN